MTFYRLHDSYPGFPDPRDAEPNGLLAMGGDLSPERLLIAYSMGIFPWYNPGDPILWHSPDPRMVLLPEELHISRSLRPVLARCRWDVRYDHDFAQVIRRCAQTPRRGQEGTWITPEMIKAYERLHELGFAHSVEVWDDDRLIGGMYGVALGRAFFGESMFYEEPNASKVALVHLVRRLDAQGYELLDCQQQTEHTARFGAFPMERDEFLDALTEALCHETERGSWAGS
ncbi:MAG: leucyl/phenylalanyl-tRNA--protein transferase [Myxococcota bacterium]|nr:leucyl/phenylalanyl-tRNA--protein transferase [Myxococcota bacterium]